jgi:hypothetical protein
MYDHETQTWHARLGALDLAGVQLLQTLFDAAQIHGAEVRLALVAAAGKDFELLSALEAAAQG